ncbi:MAG: S16 family serine protease [Nitrospiraceae bacterium]
MSVVAILLALIVQVTEGFAESIHREQLIPILGVVYGEEPVGTVSYLILSIDVRDDVHGLAVHFRSTPGRFSPMAQTAVQQAIHRSARALGQSPDSWTVVLSMPYEGVTVYGDSLSAMVGLSVVALANGRFIAPDRVITGTVKPNGRIGAVGAVPLKVDAANQAHIRRILVPDERDTGDGDWQTPFLVHISPVGSVEQAYAALTAVTSRP